MRLPAAITLLLLTSTACRDRITASSGELRLGQTRVDFPTAYLGQVKHAELEVINTGRATRTGRVTTQPPFSMQTTEVDVPGASTVSIPLTFAPESLGHFEKAFALEADDGKLLEALLSGTAAPPPDCVPSSPCRASRFDLATSACIETPANEGVECSASNACFLQATCVGGSCIGTTRDCDDHDACSTDLCDARAGCIHFPATARCAAPPDPCHISACDPVKGCTFVDAPDGTRCGPSDCSTARVCLLGDCKTLSVAAGAPCGDESPCQPRGRCVADVCVRPAPTGLTTSWTVWAPPGERVEWDAIADEDGNIYWRERAPDATTARLRSVDSQGRPRWSQPVFAPNQIALMDGVLVVRRPEGYEGRRPSDGTVIWTRDLSTPSALAGTRAYSRGLGGSVYVGYTREDAGLPLGSVIASWNVFNGSTLWTTWLPGQSVEYQTMPADENGYVYVGTWGSDFKRRYLGFSPTGAQRWSFVNPHASPAAVFGGRVYHWDHWLSETSDGGWVNEEDPKLATSGYPRLALGAISYVGSATVDAGACGAPDIIVPSLVMKLVRVDPAGSRQKWALEIARPDAGGVSLTNPVLTSTSSVVFSQSTEYCPRLAQPYVLREVLASGEPGFSCPLPGAEAYFGEGLLSGGRWIAAVRAADGGQEGVRAIDLPGVVLPEHGWATAWGNSSRDNHAR